MRTDIVINDALMEEALRATGLKTKREAVELGLRTLIRLKEQEQIKGLRGTLEREEDSAIASPNQLSEYQLDCLRRLKRLSISRSDLEQAQNFAVALRDNDWRSPSSSDVHRQALDTAVKVAYARPFTRNNRGEKGDVGRRVAKSALDVLEEHERELHGRIINMRNTIYAHSDGDVFDVSLEVFFEDEVWSIAVFTRVDGGSHSA